MLARKVAARGFGRRGAGAGFRVLAQLGQLAVERGGFGGEVGVFSLQRIAAGEGGGQFALADR